MSSIDERSRPSLARGVRLRVDPKTKEPLLLFPEGAIHLNQTAHAILTRCVGQLTTRAIIASLAAEYEADANALRQDVVECLSDLHQRKLVVFSK